MSASRQACAPAHHDVIDKPYHLWLSLLATPDGTFGENVISGQLTVCHMQQTHICYSGHALPWSGS